MASTSQLPITVVEARLAGAVPPISGMGITATGLLLLRVVDPDYETPAADAFASKQLLHEPFMGGGLWTSAAVPLLYYWGGGPVFLIACAAVAGWMLVVFLPRLLRRR